MSETFHGNLNVALVQCPLFWEDPVQNLRHIETLLYKHIGVDLFVLPEMFSTGFTMNPQTSVDLNRDLVLPALLNLSVQLSAAVCGSMCWMENGAFYNRFFFIDQGHVVYTYNKRHLFSLVGEEKVYTPGHERSGFVWKSWRIMPLICYDLRFPVSSRNSKPYTDLYIYVANWPQRRVQAWQALLPARAIENMAYVLGVNRVGYDGYDIYYNGHSAAYDALGEALCPFNQEQEEVFLISLSKSHLEECRQKFRFLDDGDKFEVFLD